MKKSLLITLTIALMSFSVQSQTRQDSTVTANKDLRAMLSAFDEWKVLKPENTLLFERVGLLNKKIAVKDSIIFNHENIISLQKITISDYISIESNLINQQSNLQKQVKRLEKTIRKQKAKTFISSLSGVVGIIAVILLK